MKNHGRGRFEDQLFVYPTVTGGGAWMGGLRSLRLCGGESGSMVNLRPWMTTWWWNQNSVVRFSGSVLPPSAQERMWWIWSR